MKVDIQSIFKTFKLNTLDHNQSLVFVKQKTGFQPSQIALSIFVLLLSYIAFTQTATFIQIIICYLIPAYYTLVSLGQCSLQLDIKYMTYWVTFGILEAFSSFEEWVFSSTIYTFLRIILTFCFLHPQINIASMLYTKIIKPIITKYQMKQSTGQTTNTVDTCYDR